MQADTISRLQHTSASSSSSVKTPSPLKGVQLPASATTQSQKQSAANNLGQLDNIFQSVRKQIDQWGENAKWKIDLVLLDSPQSQAPPPPSTQQPAAQQASPPPSSSSLHPLLSPQHLHPNAITTPLNNESTSYALPVTSTIQYPWDFVAPNTNKDEWKQDVDNLELKLRESMERQHYLESIIWSQSEQIKHSSRISDKDNAINTMKNIFLMSQNEQKVHHMMETNMLHKDIETLSRKLKKITHILDKIEKMEPAAEDQALDKEELLQDRALLKRKLYLSELRLSARDAEIDYLHELIETLKSNQQQQQQQQQNHSHHPHKKLRKGPPYLFQQQYSPRSDIRSNEPHPLSGLDSLGIVADQMLSDPEFEGSTHSSHYTNEKRLRSRLDDRRSQRSIDSAATLLAMPQLMVPQHRMTRDDSNSISSSPPLSPERALHPQPPQKPNYDHIPKKPRSTYTRWTEAEDRLLRAAVKKYGHSNWEACSKDVRGRSNIQCRNRWIRHLEHKPIPIEEVVEEQHVSSAHTPPKNARQSPSIAALLNNDNEDGGYHYSPRASSSAASSNYHLHPVYRPPSPMATPKNGKRRSPEEPLHKW
ncbi:Homeodomain-like DNA binding domain-containing transcription factor [Mucor lusitanicus]|uniref:Homeodomain-like DNA binding domain-containing transcription factor n=2 Tax=Mucor circinelloides f. lusitanicus TaxID=29924 RepID=A0A168LQ16_MUCCL|nr:Homeodomain-like DNA binding domain-containing transcription factor [Mucor lusitanicus]OAD03817.1 Homeodomain-like DNA binding domain-containing transcription factor [Mucor lusitanicus CBS 277.49]